MTRNSFLWRAFVVSLNSFVWTLKRHLLAAYPPSWMLLYVI